MEYSRLKRSILGVYLVLVSLFLALVAVALWHKVDPGGKDVWSGRAVLWGIGIEVDPEFRLILLALVGGALGSYIHAATSFATFTGNQSLMESWYWWYVLRPLIGMTLSVIFYFAVRGGFLLLARSAEDITISPFGVGALSGLVGMFSKQATDKLREVFDNLFKTGSGKGDEERSGKLANRLAREIMLPANRTVFFQLREGQSEDIVTVRELYDLIKGVVTRIPVCACNSAVRYIIHQSLLFKYISVKAMEPMTSAVGRPEPTLADFLAFENNRAFVGSLAFVSLEATVGDAKRAMELTANCQDVVVTRTANRDEPFLGWLTNTEIGRNVGWQFGPAQRAS